MRKILLSKVAFILTLVIFATVSTFAQVTSSSISGLVADDKNEGLPGATVIAIHTPSGTRYGTVTGSNGRYNLPNVKVGGPYSVKVTFIGFEERAKSDIFTNLGTASNVNFVMLETGKALDEVVVKSAKNNIMSSERTGAASNFNKDAIQNMPTINRTLNSITKYNAYGNGNSFAGQDSRFNNITIDGSVFNNGFGLGQDASAGGRTGTSAISIDAIEQVQVNVAPFDVRQSGFAGAGINAVTRSGTNQVQGSVYGFQKGDNLIGKKAMGVKIPATVFDESSYGFRIGAPIIKNKLFIFANAEVLKRSAPALDWQLNRNDPAQVGNISRTTLADMEDLSKFMKEKFNYDLGALDGFNNDITSTKFLTRLDYNINDKNKLSVRYSYHESASDNLISGSNSGNLAGFGNRTNSNQAISPKSTGYGIQDNTRSIAVELNSNFKNKFSNTFLATYNKQIEDRNYTSIFPTIEIQKAGATYTTIGMDPFTPNNRLDYGTFNLTNNLTYFAGKHTFTFGAALEHFKSNNLFFFSSNGVWVFDGIDNFKKAANEYLANPTVVPGTTKSATPIVRFNYRYSLNETGEAPWQRLGVNTNSAYAQDEFQATKNLKITAGIRMDIISVKSLSGDYYNPVADTLKFRNADSALVRVNTAQLPKSKANFSPRIGFNWDVKGDRSLQVRGGSGLFLSRMPYVLISNQLGTNGVNIAGLRIDQTTSNSPTLNYPFTLDPSVYRPTNTNIGNLSGYPINISDPNLKFPQVWKSNLAIDYKFKGGIVATVEGIYNDNVNALYYQDVNLKEATNKFKGVDTRDLYPTARALNSKVTNVFMLTNTSKGYSYTLTTKLEKQMDANGVGGMIGYTYGMAKDLSSVASTVNANTPSIRGINYLDLSYADNYVPHRIVGYVNKKFNYLNGKASTMITLAGTSNSGYRTSYTYNNQDFNLDGQNNDLIFVPQFANNLTFTSFNVIYTDPTTKTSKTKTFSAAEQANAYDVYLDNNPYLSTRRGKYAERNGGFAPWFTRLDLAVEQDFSVKAGKNNNTLRFRVDVQNLGNLLNNEWGVGYLNNGNPIARDATLPATGIPTYRLRTINDAKGEPQLIKDSFTRAINFDNVYQIQLGVRYIFN